MQPLPNEEASGGSLVIDGHLVCAIEHHRRLRSDQPPDHLCVFRNDESWTTLALRQTEGRLGDSAVLSTASAEVAVQRHLEIEALETAINERYGHAAWEEVLDAGHLAEPMLFGPWSLRQIERDLEAATFYRPDLVRVSNPDLDAEIANHLCRAGFDAVIVRRPRSSHRPETSPVLAETTAHRLGHQIEATVRIDPQGEVYARLDHAEPIGDDDE